jgi:hypothetical protein
MTRAAACGRLSGAFGPNASGWSAPGARTVKTTAIPLNARFFRLAPMYGASGACRQMPPGGALDLPPQTASFVQGRCSSLASDFQLIPCAAR